MHIIYCIKLPCQGTHPHFNIHSIHPTGIDSFNQALLSHTAVVCVDASAVVVSGHVGGEVSIHCSGSWTTHNSPEHFNMYFCKGVCSRENTIIQTENKMLAVTRRGRYSMEVSSGDGAFSVTMKRLKMADAGSYHCGVGKTFNVLYQEVNLIVLNGKFLVRSLETWWFQTKCETMFC